MMTLPAICCGNGNWDRLNGNWLGAWRPTLQGKIYLTGDVCNQALWSASIPKLYPRCGNAGVTSTFVCYSAESDEFCGRT